MSPTYLSRVERDDCNPPSEEKVRAIAAALGQDADKMLALAGRLSVVLARMIASSSGDMDATRRVVERMSAVMSDK